MTSAELTALRQQIGWTRPELARRTGISPRYIDHMETGARPVTEAVAALATRVAEAVRIALVAPE